MITTKTKEILKKNSFTLFEVLVSLIILGITISGIARVFTQENINETYYQLQSLENNYIENNIISNTNKIKFNLK